MWWKISVTKFRKSKIWVDSFVAFYIGFLVVYSIFSGDTVFMVKFAKQNGHFLTFSKTWKKLILNIKFLNQNCTKLNFLWAHLNACSARIILDPRIFIRGPIGGLFLTFLKVSMKKKICCTSSSMPKKCPHFSDTGNQKTVEWMG